MSTGRARDHAVVVTAYFIAEAVDGPGSRPSDAVLGQASELVAALEDEDLEVTWAGEFDRLLAMRDARERRLRSLAQWLVALDEPDATERRTITLTEIIQAAKYAIGGVE